MHTQLVKQLTASHYMGEWHAILGMEQDFKCVYCGVDFLQSTNDYLSAQLDHIKPVAAGGVDDFENRTVCCATCNYIKRAYDPEGTTRAERIADAGRHVRSERAESSRRLDALRGFIAENLRRPNQ
jgi:hypothetical protein